jgi:hypothetical protein
MTAARGHEYSFDGGEYHAPTCEENGYKIGKCVLCGTMNPTSTPINALGHTYAYKDLVAPTYTQNGSVVVYCTRCGNNQLVTLVAMENVTTGEITQIQQEDCQQEGIYKYSLDLVKYLGLDMKGTLMITFQYTKDKTDCDLSEKIYEWEDTIGGVTYICYGRLCSMCNEMIVIDKVEKDQANNNE